MSAKVTTMDPVERVSSPTPELFFARYASCGRPVVIKDAMRSWACVTRWTDDYLVDKLGSRRFLVNKSTNGAFGIYSSRMHKSEECLQVGFKEFLDLVYASDPARSDSIVYYMQQKTIQETFPELADEVDYATFLDRSAIRDVNLWISQRGSNIPLHYDSFDNLLAQVRGTKYIRLWSPRQTPYLYPGRDGASFASRVDVYDPDLSKYPLFANAQLYGDLSLGEGDILYIPAFWWHHVVTETQVSFSVNYWYHLVYGHSRDGYMAVRDILKSALHYLRQLPRSQQELALAECRRMLDETAPAAD